MNIEIANIYLPDVLRGVMALAVGFDLLFFPHAMQLWKYPDRVVHMVIAIELIMIGAAAGPLTRWGFPLRIYGTPVVLVGAIWLAYYIVRAMVEVKRGKNF